MRLFHGSSEIITAPKIITPNRTLDFGIGFYTTTSEQQAQDWAIRRGKSLNAIRCYTNEYRVAEKDINSLKHLHFNETSDEWLDFVMANRTNPNFTHDFDIVSGPAADDRVYAAFALFEAGLLNRQQLIAELKAYTLVNQYLFHTDRALSILCYWNSKMINF